MEQQMRRWNEIISIACTECQLVKADSHSLHLRLGTVKTGANHPTSGTSLLNVALAEGCREGEFAVVEGIIEIEIQCLLRDFSLMDIYLATSHFLMTMECLGREIDHIKAIAVAIGIEVELKVLILASQLGWVYSQTKPQATISHSHGEGSTAVGHHLGMGFRSIRLRRSFQIGSRKIASQFDGPSGMRTGDVGSIILYLVIIGCQQ